ncbi:hypothetical protein Tco_0701054 [Tanacetum coccineum]
MLAPSGVGFDTFFQAYDNLYAMIEQSYVACGQANPKCRGFDEHIGRHFGGKYTDYGSLEKKQTRLRTNTKTLQYLKSQSLGEETDKTTDLYQHLSRLCSQRLETASQDTYDAVTLHHTTVSQHLTTASTCTTQPKI